MGLNGTGPMPTAKAPTLSPLKGGATRIQARPQTNLKSKKNLHGNNTAQQTLKKVSKPTHEKNI
jgi:hypothetical protein